MSFNHQIPIECIELYQKPFRSMIQDQREEHCVHTAQSTQQCYVLQIKHRCIEPVAYLVCLLGAMFFWAFYSYFSIQFFFSRRSFMFGIHNGTMFVSNDIDRILFTIYYSNHKNVDRVLCFFVAFFFLHFGIESHRERIEL